MTCPIHTRCVLIRMLIYVILLTKTLRPIPLTPHEETLYQDFFLRRDTLARKKKPVNKNLEFWGQIGDALISRYTVDLDKLGSVRCSPLINPFL